MAGDIRIQKARARWQRVNQSINAGYTRRNTSSLCSLASSRAASSPATAPASTMSRIPQKTHEIKHPCRLVKWSCCYRNNVFKCSVWSSDVWAHVLYRQLTSVDISQIAYVTSSVYYNWHTFTCRLIRIIFMWNAKTTHNKYPFIVL